MSQHTVLVIDDSATIRRLVDSSLTPVGYQVFLAASAEEGIARAIEVRPDLILLDHQLPGTTGVDVCRQLLADERLQKIPVVASSTLRKKAYVEYADCSNVVDMLPKPYTAELLVTTVSNAIDTASLIVDSQRDGTAVPEVMQALDEVALSGDFRHFSLRSVLDFLNNGNQTGVLEAEGGNQRARIYLSRGRIQAVTATGVDVEDVCARLPESLRDLGPVLRLTLGGRGGSQIDGLVQLLDNRVLDPRLLQKLLRHQASVLLLHCFTQVFTTFRFEYGRVAPALQDRLPLEMSIIALLVEAMLVAPPEEVPPYHQDHAFVRRAIRGQNLDRAGLSAAHQKLMTLLNEPITPADVAERTGLAVDEVVRVLNALALADLVEVRRLESMPRVVVFETDPQMALRLREVAAVDGCPVALKVVRDRLSLQLVLKRQHPDALVLAIDSEAGHQLAQELARDHAHTLQDTRWISIGEPINGILPIEWAAQWVRPYSLDQLFEWIVSSFSRSGQTESTLV